MLHSLTISKNCNLCHSTNSCLSIWEFSK